MTCSGPVLAGDVLYYTSTGLVSACVPTTNDSGITVAGIAMGATGNGGTVQVINSNSSATLTIGGSLPGAAIDYTVKFSPMEKLKLFTLSNANRVQVIIALIRASRVTDYIGVDDAIISDEDLEELFGHYEDVGKAMAELRLEYDRQATLASRRVEVIDDLDQMSSTRSNIPSYRYVMAVRSFLKSPAKPPIAMLMALRLINGKQVAIGGGAAYVRVSDDETRVLQANGSDLQSIIADLKDRV